MLIRKSKKYYYSQLDTRDIVDNKTFWKTIKPIMATYSEHNIN